MTSTKRRVKAIGIQQDIFAQIFETGKIHAIVDGIPEGTKIIGWERDAYRRLIIILAEHESFPKVDELASLELMYITHRRIEGIKVDS